MKRALATLVLLVAILADSSSGVRGQEPGPTPSGLSAADEERLRMLSDPEALKQAAARDKLRTPFEFYRSQVAPSDVLPWVKARHWHGLTVELRANLDDYVGSLQTTPIEIPGSASDLTFGREARLVKEQRSRLGMPILLPRAAGVKDLPVEMIQEGAIRPDQVYSAAVRPLAPHQMITLVLSKGANAGYAPWGRLNATMPATLDREDVQAADALRYYRLVLPLEPDKPLLPTHPLTWTAISHIVWDGLEPDVLSVSHQQALIDWIHWGGQLVMMGGAGPKFSVLRESFLEPYLPADSSGEGRALTVDELAALSAAYRPPPGAVAAVAPEAGPDLEAQRAAIYGRSRGPDFGVPPPRRATYDAPDPIRPQAGRPVQAAGLRPRPGATVVPIGGEGGATLAVERRVGRGRITMLAVDPTDPALASWKGIDTFVRRVVFRRAEESTVALGMASGSVAAVRSMQGPDLSWYRIAARDVDAPSPASEPAPDPRPEMRTYVQPNPAGGETIGVDYGFTGGEIRLPELGGVAEWRDEARIPRLGRDALELASGIKVPSSSFVLKVILAYVLAVAPLNWLVCRVILRRREAAWVVVPILALGFAIGVERVAAYDLGFDSACDEIDVLEVQESHPRGHLSRFVSLYSTGHGRFAIRFPDDPTALALPFASGRSIAGEDRTTSAWRSYPVPALEDFTVQPRSLAMFRAEQMLDLPGPIAIEEDGPRRTIRNGSGLELRDSTLVEYLGPGEFRETYLGAIAPDADVDLDGLEPRDAPARVAGFDGPDPSAMLAAFRNAWEDRPEAVGEVRLVAWTPGPASGPRFEPALDRHRGATVVVAHLRYGSPPSPGGRSYDLTAPENE